ncbi:Uncharacterized protein FWK35_00001502 [Aphis craccivora]|uniref:Uncharacterized protein n=1 Tax=Aphis craccivora TaxID=307492 RepID=A0A6G0ZB17_APHCR|nr:Uncharacterized protein FWK35_00001502 [Aphis craccivora]
MQWIQTQFRNISFNEIRDEILSEASISKRRKLKLNNLANIKIHKLQNELNDIKFEMSKMSQDKLNEILMKSKISDIAKIKNSKSRRIKLDAFLLIISDKLLVSKICLFGRWNIRITLTTSERYGERADHGLVFLLLSLASSYSKPIAMSMCASKGPATENIEANQFYPNSTNFKINRTS